MAHKEKLERLKASRGAHRGVVTKVIKEVEKILGPIENTVPLEAAAASRLNILRLTLEQKQRLLERYDQEILDVCEVENIGKEIGDSDAVSLNIVSTQSKIQERLVPNKSPSVTEDTSTALNAVTPIHSFENTVKPKLPKLHLEMFRTFWEGFKSSIDSNEKITPMDKFKYLQSLLEGQAARVIQGLSLTETNYKYALELLEQCFGQKQIIISAHMDNLLKLNACQGEKSYQLRYLFDQIRVQIRGLESLGVEVDSYGSLLIPVIMSKLPSNIRLQVSRATKQRLEH